MNRQEQIAREWIKTYLGEKISHASENSEGLDFHTMSGKTYEVKSIGKTKGQKQDKICFKIGQIQKMKPKYDPSDEVTIVIVDRQKEKVVMTFKICEVEEYQ